MNKKYITNDEASEIITQLGLEFVILNNPDNIFPQFEIYPLAPKITYPQKALSALLMNLEGGLVSTERLHLHALEYMVRQISGRFEKEQWFGLDKIIDHPNILSGVNANPVDFLIQRYHNFIKPEFFREAYFHSALWTLILGKDENRKDEVRKNLISLGCKEMLNDPKLNEYIARNEFGKYNANLITNYFLNKYGPEINLQNFYTTAHAASDIYHKRYQEILDIIKLGEGNNLAEELLEGDIKLFIEPAPGTAALIAIIKGWLGEDSSSVFDELDEFLKRLSSQNYRISDKESARGNLIKLASFFQTNPLKIGIVSSGIRYDTSIIINEALNIMSTQIRMWKIPEEKKQMLLNKFSDSQNIFDGIVTISDSNKIRQKPFRDIYSIAIDRLGLHKSRFNEIIGLENSENGIISLRTSGIGLTAAIPPVRSGSTQNLAAASYILQGGIAELLLNYNCFLSI